MELKKLTENHLIDLIHICIRIIFIKVKVSQLSMRRLKKKISPW